MAEGLVAVHGVCSIHRLLRLIEYIRFIVFEFMRFIRSFRVIRLFLGLIMEVEVTTTPYSIKGSRAEVFRCPGLPGY